MKRQFPISNTFQVLRKLPLEVSFEQVEQWLQQKNFNNSSKIKRQPFWLDKLLALWSSN